MQTAFSSYRGILASYLKPQRRRVILLGALLLAGIGFELANPWILRAFIDDATASAPLDRLTMLAVLFLVAALGAQLVTVGEAYVAENVGLTATNQIRSDLTLHTLRLDPQFHGSHTPGELIERVDGDVATLGNFFSRFVVQIFANGILLVAVLVLMYTIDWRVGLAMTIFVIVTVALVNKTRNIAQPFWKVARQASAELFGFIEERLSGTEDIRSSGATAYTMRKLYERSRTPAPHRSQGRLDRQHVGGRDCDRVHAGHGVGARVGGNAVSGGRYYAGHRVPHFQLHRVAAPPNRPANAPTTGSAAGRCEHQPYRGLAA